ncbi:SMI1/KNR4 family protein [Streptomyces sp. NPDC050400]|uniref:SMI1/KNR4 family protein n=1 Tax=Streptomyces sp. NPDC050400 TaxID=3365610 RepID=UPI00379D9D72
MEQAERRARGWSRPDDQPVFEPVLTAAEIAEVEDQYGVELPEEYRTFLTEVGAGGPGPEHELTSLRRIDGNWVWIWGTHDVPMRPDPSGPFVESEHWRDRQVATLRAAGHEPTTPDEDDDYYDDYLTAFGEAGENLWYQERVRGAVQISDNGCGMTGWLILVGPHRGELRDRDCADNPPFEPYADAHGMPHTFRSWYLEWLQRRENEMR